MEIQDLFMVALMPVLKTLVIAIVGLILALDRVNILDPIARHKLNNLVFYIFFPSLLASSLIGSINATNIISLWFIPVSILMTFIVGSALGFILSRITTTPKHLEGLVISCCAAGNMGNLPVIIIPAICAEKNNPFGDSVTCTKNGMAYVSLSMAMGAIFVWSLSFNIIRAYGTITHIESSESTESLLINHGEVKVSKLKALEKKILEILLRPPTIASIMGLIIIAVSPLQNLMIGDNAPLRVIQSSVVMLGEAAVPSMTLIMGANLLKGFKESEVGPSLNVGLVIVRFILLPLCGIAIVKAAQILGIVGTDPLYHFVLLLQYAVPPAMALGTITQLFGIGETESSVLLFWNYAAAGIALTLWSTYFMWILC